jgi:hypothetical protein
MLAVIGGEQTVPLSPLLAALQSVVLSCPLTVVRLMELLGSPREVLRNEALLMLAGLTSGCEDISKLAAFEGAFDKLLGLCLAEGGLVSGGVVVQDALELLNNMLRDNQANQRLFREMGHMQQIPKLLHYQAAPAAGPGGVPGAPLVDPAFLAAAGAAAAAAAGVSAAAAAGARAVGAAAAAAAASVVPQLPVQAAANYLSLLETTRLLMAPPHGATADLQQQEAASRLAAQQAFGHLGLLQVLLGLAVNAGKIPHAVVRAQALLCLADWLAEHPAGQQAVGGSGVEVAGGKRMPALHVVLKIALQAWDTRERSGAAAVLAGFCRANPEGQLTLISTMAPGVGKGPGEEVSWGQELVGAMLGGPEGPEGWKLAARAAGVLQQLLVGNVAAQERLLGLPLAMGQSGVVMLGRCMSGVSHGLQQGDVPGLALAATLLRLLVVWAHGSTPTVTALLEGSWHLDLLVGVVGAKGEVGRDNVHVAGKA